MSNRYTLQIENTELKAENAELEKQLKTLKRLLFKANKELDLYKNRGHSARKVRVDAIEEMVDHLHEHEGRLMVDDILAHANKLKGK